MISKTGHALIDDQAIKVLTGKLLPLAAIVTPNRHEAARLLGQDAPIADVAAATAAAKQICDRFGARACVVKGIRRALGEEGEAVDVFYDGEKAQEVVAEWRNTPNTHGSGCTFAAAIAAALAAGQPIDQAVTTAKAVVTEAIRQQTGIGHGQAPVNHLAYLDVKKKK
jgi:hydroxymethylpyrimidine/phosphomethylpyrimidine kinase